MAAYPPIHSFCCMPVSLFNIAASLSVREGCGGFSHTQASGVKDEFFTVLVLCSLSPKPSHCPEFLIDTASNQNLTVGRPGNEAKFSGHVEISSLAHARYKNTAHTIQ